MLPVLRHIMPRLSHIPGHTDSKWTEKLATRTSKTPLEP